MALPEWVILHIPHDSSLIPAKERKHLHLNDAELHSEMLVITDHWTLDLFARDVSPSQVVRAGFSRLVVDVERFENDSEEPMSACGMGVIYERTSDGRRLREPPSAEERERMVSTYYRPHHDRLASAVNQSLRKHQRALILDCHSFPSKPLACDQDQRPDRPDICIGMDAWHTPRDLAKSLAEAFRKNGWSVAIDAPFSGSMVPLMHYHRTKAVASVMIEVNRNRYINETTGERHDEFDVTKRMLWECLNLAIRP